MARYTLNVNGAEQTVEETPDTPLLWVLRERLGLAGTKFGCGVGLCGACVVHVDGAPVNACMLSVAEATGKRITTIEGLSSSGDHPVQRAWLAEQVPQCGYCQSGQIMAAAALLARIPDPTDAQIDAAMDPVLCRCGTYPRIRRAIHRAARLARQERRR
jgi:aerobic-type carbon monoxide dehydrogenase small subunit (CoxS/CutS family)